MLSSPFFLLYIYILYIYIYIHMLSFLLRVIISVFSCFSFIVTFKMSCHASLQLISVSPLCANVFVSTTCTVFFSSFKSSIQSIHVSVWCVRVYFTIYYLFSQALPCCSVACQVARICIASFTACFLCLAAVTGLFFLYMWSENSDSKSFPMPD